MKGRTASLLLRELVRTGVLVRDSRLGSTSATSILATQPVISTERTRTSVLGASVVNRYDTYRIEDPFLGIEIAATDRVWENSGFDSIPKSGESNGW